MRDLFERVWGFLESKFGIPKNETPRALPMRLIENDNDEYCWEDWHTEMKIKYPVRHWLFNEFNIWASVKYKILVEDPIDWFKSKFLLKEHIVDLRGTSIGTYEEVYKGGYINYSDVIQLSTYKAFKRYTDRLYSDENNLDNIIKRYESFIKDASRFDRKYYLDGIKFFKRVQRIDYFFEVELREEYSKSLSFLNNSRNLSREERKKLYEEHRKSNEILEMKVTRYLCEIIKIRNDIQNYDSYYDFES